MERRLLIRNGERKRDLVFCNRHIPEEEFAYAPRSVPSQDLKGKCCTALREYVSSIMLIFKPLQVGVFF